MSELWINLKTGTPYTEEQGRSYNALIGREDFVPISDPRARELLDAGSERAAAVRERWRRLFDHLAANVLE